MLQRLSHQEQETDRPRSKKNTRLGYDWSSSDKRQLRIFTAASRFSTDLFADPFDDRLAQADESSNEFSDDSDDSDDLDDLFSEDGELKPDDEEETMELAEGIPSDITDLWDSTVPPELPPDEPESKSETPMNSGELPVPKDESDEPFYLESTHVQPEPTYPYAEEDELGQGDDEHTENADRVYNDYDCAAGEEYCREKWAQLSAQNITQVSLDITPSFDPNAADEGKAKSVQDEKLSQSGRRSWLGQDGSVLAEGQFKDYRNGRVFVTDDDGSAVSVRYNKLSDDDACFVNALWGLPNECRLSKDPFDGRNWVPLTLTWKASALCHKPLYFEQEQVERHGHSFGPVAQPIISGAHFFGHFIVLPYQMGIHPPHECEYALGHYRPGNCAPYLFPPFPLSIHGGLFQAGTIAGLIYAIP